MSYIVPRRPLRANDVLDHVELDEDVVPTAERYSGRLNAHNFRTNLKTAPVTVGTQAYLVETAAMLQRTNSNHGLTTASLTPNTAAAQADRIPNDGHWFSLSVISPISVTTGNSVLILLADAQYFVQTWGITNWTATLTDQYTSPANIQFAFRVDSTLVFATQTGARRIHETAFSPLKSDDEKGSGTGPNPPLAGQMHSLGALAGRPRIGAYVPVVAGTHTVELVARRTPDLTNQQNYDSDNYLMVYGRQLYAIESPVVPGATSAAAVVSVSSWEPEDVLSAAAIGTNRVGAVRTVYNAVAEGALARGAFRNTHLPSVVLQSRQVSVNSATTQWTDDFYPGYNTATIAAARSGDSGWMEVDNGAGAAILRATPSGGGDWVGNSGLLIVMANLQTTSLQRFNSTGAEQYGDEQTNWALFDIGWHVDGDPAATINFGVASEFVFCTDNTYYDDVSAPPRTYLPGERDVNLLYVRDLTASPIAPAVDYFSIYASTLPAINVAPPNRARVTWRQRGSIQALRLRL